MKASYVKIKDGLFLVAQQPASQAVVKTVEINTHHIFIIDCSGSMYGELPSIRRDMCNKLSTLLKVGDSLTLIWFSGRGEYGVILEDYRINGAINVEKAKGLVNQYLTARCLTAFVDPLKEASALIDRVMKTNTDMVHSLFFITDGYDNQYSRQDILAAVKAMKDKINSATMVEYGWYCNRKLMVDMATMFGGTHQHSKDFQDYEPLVQRQFTHGVTARRSYIELVQKSVDGIAFTIVDGVITAYEVEKGGVFMPVGDETTIFYFTDDISKVTGIDESFTGDVVPANMLPANVTGAMYAAMSIASKNLDNDRMSDLMKYVGDARLISLSANTFGTQKITELEKEFEQAAISEGMRYSLGYDPNMMPNENAYCFLDMLADLMSDDQNAWYPRHDWFEYERTGKKMVSASEKLNESEKKRMAEAAATGDVKKIKEVMDEISASKPIELEFSHAEENPSSPFSRMVWNSTRANLSVQVTYRGSVELPDNKFGVPKDFETVIVRNYMLVKDGIIHTYIIPVSLSKLTFDKLQSNGLLVGEKYEENKIYKLDFSSLPVINRGMVKLRPSAEELCRKTHELTSIQGYTAVMNYYRKLHHVSASKGFAELYGADGAEWLKELGLMPYGYSPKRVAEKTGEELSVPALDIKMLKASLPSGKAEIEKVIAKIQKGVELSARERWFEAAIRDYMEFVRITKGAGDKLIVEWIDGKFKSMDAQRRMLISDIAKIKFMITVGKLWFREFKSRTENTMTLTIDGNEFNFVLDDSEEVVKL